MLLVHGDSKEVKQLHPAALLRGKEAEKYMLRQLEGAENISSGRLV